MAKKDECKHSGGYKMVEGILVCALCQEPSASKRWKRNVWGDESKAVGQGATEDKQQGPQTNK